MKRRIIRDRALSLPDLFASRLTETQLRKIAADFGVLPEVGKKRLYLKIIYAVQNHVSSMFGNTTPIS